MSKLVTITTSGGMVLRADSSRIGISETGRMFAFWNMRFNLINNAAYYYSVSPSDIAEIKYHG